MSGRKGLMAGIARRLSSILAVVLVLVAVAAVPVQADGRIALVIGNGAYSIFGELPNPKNDASDVGAVFERLGFDVTTVLDGERARMQEALQAFARRSVGADVALVFYAGHGIEMDGVNYLIPVDARLERDTDVEFETVQLDQVLRATEGAGLRVVILDACRNNPLAQRMQRARATRSISRGSFGDLDEQRLLDESLVAYAAAAGTTAADGSGRNSPYTAALLEYLEAPLELSALFRRVRGRVLETTGGAQRPHEYQSLLGDHYLSDARRDSGPDLVARYSPPGRADAGAIRSRPAGRASAAGCSPAAECSAAPCRLAGGVRDDVRVEHGRAGCRHRCPAGRRSTRDSPQSRARCGRAGRWGDRAGVAHRGRSRAVGRRRRRRHRVHVLQCRGVAAGGRGRDGRGRGRVPGSLARGRHFGRRCARPCRHPGRRGSPGGSGGRSHRGMVEPLAETGGRCCLLTGGGVRGRTQGEGLMHLRFVQTAVFIVLAGAFVSPQPATAQVDLGGATRISFSGSIADITDASGFVALGASRVTEGGAEFGGDLLANISENGVTGFAFVRGGYNFIGESLTVPFVSFGVGTPLGGELQVYPYEAGGGIKRFISESASFDVSAHYRGNVERDGWG